MPAAVAAALDLRALPGQELVDALVDFLAPRSFLLVMDNCEHVLGTSATLVDRLLRAAPGLTVVATSREPLRVAGEVVFRVPSLAIPDLQDAPAPDELLRFEAVRLFVDRASAAAPDFALDEDNAADVARICVRLDGLPLALELAASRLGALGPAVVAERLDDRFRVLRARSHTAPTRQQTLQATLQWSHDLLEEDERLLFRRLAVFAGGFELGAVEAVCAGDGLEPSETVDVLARLVEKSLVARERASAGESRYRLLETVRLYARQQLDAAGETLALADRHARLGTRPGRARGRPPRARPRGGEPARGAGHAARAAAAGRPPSVRRAVDVLAAADRPGRGVPALRRRAGGGPRADIVPRRGPARRRRARGARRRPRPDARHAGESLSVADEVGDARAEWAALHFQGSFAITYAVGNALGWLEPALALARRERLEAEEALGIYTLGVAHWFLGDPASAETLVAEGIEAFRALDDPGRRIESPINVAEMRVPAGGGRPGVRIVLEDSFQPFVEVTCDAALSYALVNQASVLRVRGDFERARALLDESDAALSRRRRRARPGRRARPARLPDLAEGSMPDARDCLEQALDSAAARTTAAASVSS